MRTIRHTNNTWFDFDALSVAFHSCFSEFFLPSIIRDKHAHAECIETLWPINNARL